MSNPASPPLKYPIVEPARCLQWLVRGGTDLRRNLGLSLAHGLAMALFGAGVFGLAHDRFWLLAGAFSGFLLVAPILAVGLYAISRANERGHPATLATVLDIWRSGDARLVAFGCLLALAGTGWVITSAALITLYAHGAVAAPVDFLREVVLGPGWLFEAWLALGGLLAAPIFASTVVAIPLLVDRPLSVLDAVLASWRVVAANPVPMGCWAAIIMLLAAIGMGTALLGLVVLIPLLGHASWHAYRDLVQDAAE